MKVYVVTYRTADGSLVEHRVVAENHKKATKMLIDNGAVEIVSIYWESDDDVVAPTVASPLKGSLIALLLGGLIALGVFAVIWVKKGCPSL